MYMKLLFFMQKMESFYKNFLLYYIFIPLVKSQFDHYTPNLTAFLSKTALFTQKQVKLTPFWSICDSHFFLKSFIF